MVTKTRQDLKPGQLKALEYQRERITLDPADATRVPLESVWDLCAQYYEGISDLSENALLRHMEARNQAELLTENRILPAVQRAVSLIFSGQPTIFAVPASADREDKEAAVLAQVVYDEYAERTNMAEKDRRALLLTAVTGCAIFKTCWNPMGGKRLAGKGVAPSFQGDVDVEVFSPWEFWIDPYARTIEEAQWAATVRLISLERVTTLYPHLKKELEGASHAVAENVQRRTRLFSGSGPWFGSAADVDPANRSRGIFIIDFWSRPTDKYPKGLRLISAGNHEQRVLLHDKIDNPYVGLSSDNSLELPFDQATWTPPVMSFWPIGLVHPAIGIQREINKSSRDIAANRALLSNPRIMNPKGNGCDDGIPANPEELIHFDPNVGPPIFVPPPSMPEYVVLQHNRLLEALGTILAQSDASQAKAPGEVRTGVAIELLQEKDESVYGPIRARFYQKTKAGVAKKFLTLAQNYYTTERTIAVVGKNRAVNIKSFQGSDLHGASDVRFQIDTSVGTTRVSRRQTVMEWMQMGLLNPQDPRHLMIIADILQTQALDPVLHDFFVEQQEAEDEYAIMADPERLEDASVIQVDPLQDSAIHSHIKRLKTRTREFRALPIANQQIIRQNVMHHMLLLDRQAQLEAALAGGTVDPAEAGGGSPEKEKGVASQPKPPKTEGQITEAKQQGGMQ